MDPTEYEKLLAQLSPLCAVTGCENPRAKGIGFSCIAVDKSTNKRCKIVAGFCKKCMDEFIQEYKARSQQGGMTLERLNMKRVYREEVKFYDPITEEEFKPFMAEQIVEGMFDPATGKWDESRQG